MKKHCWINEKIILHQLLTWHKIIENFAIAVCSFLVTLELIQENIFQVTCIILNYHNMECAQHVT